MSTVAQFGSYLVSPLGEYYAYNTITVADVLDEAASKIRWLSDQHKFGQIFQIDRHECFPEKMQNLSVFRLVEMSSRTLVTYAFVQRVLRHALQGFRFIKLWPLPDGMTWEEFEKLERRKYGMLKTTQSRRAKANTLVILLPFNGAQPTASELREFGKIKDEIDALLFQPTAKLESPRIGSLEGDDIADGELRIFLTCLSADSLAEKLHPWLKSISWKGIRALKRYGDISDKTCRQEELKL